MRPLFFEDSSAHWSENDAQQYMWGSAFLVHPVTNKNESTTQVRLPKNQIWYDFHSGKKVDVKNELTINGKEPFSIVNYENSMDHIPVFVKGGSFIPMCAVNQSLDDYHPEQVVIHYYVSGNQSVSKGYLYNDNGLNSSKKNKIEIPDYQWMDFYFAQKKKNSTLTISSYRGEMKDLDFVIHGIDKKPRKITMNGKEIEFEYNVKQELKFKLVGLKNANYLSEFDQKDFIRILH
jgi:alpha-glucosidase (family GH31 glycosyl hydrolase)